MLKIAERSDIHNSSIDNIHSSFDKVSHELSILPQSKQGVDHAGVVQNHQSLTDPQNFTQVVLDHHHGEPRAVSSSSATASKANPIQDRLIHKLKALNNATSNRTSTKKPIRGSQFDGIDWAEL
jgi:hypothetical protein